MPVEIEIEGISTIRAKLIEAAARADEVTRAATVTASALVERNAKDQLRKSSHRRKEPTPSSPGEPPSLVDGTLMRSVQTQGPTGTAGTYMASIGPTAVYGRIQELGGQAGRNHASTLPPRPYMNPAWTGSMPEIETTYYTAWSAIFR